MTRFALLLALALAGCAGTPPARIITLTPAVPPSVLICAPAPAIPAASSQAAVADYLVSLWQAGQDCRAHLAAVRRALAK